MRINIQWLGDNAQPSDDPVKGSPCIEIGLSPNAQTPSAERRVLWATALVDTGADFVGASQDLISDLGLEQIGTVSQVNASPGTGIFGAHLFVRGGELAIPSIVIPWSFGDGVPYRLLLGRSFLQYFSLVVSPIGESFLEELPDVSHVRPLSSYLTSPIGEEG